MERSSRGENLSRYSRDLSRQAEKRKVDKRNTRKMGVQNKLVEEMFYYISRLKTYGFFFKEMT